MKLKHVELKPISYPKTHHLIVGTAITVSLALIGCTKKKEPQRTTPVKENPALPDSHPASTTAKPEEPGATETHTTKKPEPATADLSTLDTDGDGVPDARDKCPRTRGAKYNDGCPVRKRGVMVRPRNP